MSSQMESGNVPLEKFDWLQIKKEIGSSYDEDVHVETGWEKLKRKFSENPFVPIGCLATSTCLGYGLYSFRLGERKMSQLMMRWRVVAQGFTVFALIGGLAVTAFSPEKKETKNN